MLAVPVFNSLGERQSELEVDPSVFGGKVRPALLKQAIVAYCDHQRQQSARTKGRSQIEGSTRKLYRQKGTGNARVGPVRSPLRRGGGRTFAKLVPRSIKAFPKKMRRLARSQALLAKIQAGDLMIVEDLNFAQVKTKAFAAMLSALGARGGCLVVTHEPDRKVYLSGRNIPKTDIRWVGQLHAYEILRRPKLLLTQEAFKRLQGNG